MWWVLCKAKQLEGNTLWIQPPRRFTNEMSWGDWVQRAKRWRDSTAANEMSECGGCGSESNRCATCGVPSGVRVWEAGRLDSLFHSLRRAEYGVWGCLLHTIAFFQSLVHMHLHLHLHPSWLRTSHVSLAAVYARPQDISFTIISLAKKNPTAAERWGVRGKRGCGVVGGVNSSLEFHWTPAPLSLCILLEVPPTRFTSTPFHSRCTSLDAKQI